MTATRRILLADADAFYVGVARLIDPEGAGRAPLLIVGGSADGRGVVTSASYEARAYGVHSAMPTAQALRLCPKATVAPVPMEACAEKSREIRDVLERFSPVVEPASIDEFYIDLSGTEHLYHHEPLGTTAARIREAVTRDTQISVSIGGGTSKLVAKLAAKRAKPRPGRDGTGVYIVPDGEEAAFVATLHLADIPMIGPKFQERLARFGMHTVRDALQHDEATLTAWFGKRTGKWLFHRVRGRDTGTVVHSPRAKSVGHEQTFARDLMLDDDLHDRLLRLAVRVAADLRRKRLCARTITVKIRDADFTTRQASHTLPEPVSADRPIVDTAHQLLHRLRLARRSGARLLGVSLSQLAPPGTAPQLELFADEADNPAIESAHDRELAQVVDNIQRKFGRQGIRRAAEVRPRERS